MSKRKKENYRSIISGIIYGVIIQIIVNLFVSYFDLTKETYGQFLIGNYAWFIIPVSIGLIYYSIARHVRLQQATNLPYGFYAGLSPLDSIIGQMEARYFDVKWEVDIGHYIGSALINGKPLTRVHGPFCPKCNYELDSYKKLSFFGWKDKYFWRCEPCDIEIQRPEKSLCKEDEVVGKYALNVRVQPCEV